MPIVSNRKLPLFVALITTSILCLTYLHHANGPPKKHPDHHFENGASSSRFQVITRNGYQIYQNYILAEKLFSGREAVTYTTHSDVTFLDNLIPLTERWQGPVSIAIYAPGRDFFRALAIIEYYRSCHEKSSLIRDFVTFHIYAQFMHGPKIDWTLHPDVNCSDPRSIEVTKTYKSEKKLAYPVNVGRNIAREAALTEFVLASDIELYPNPGLIEGFLKMISRSQASDDDKPKAYVVSIFEIEKGVELPGSKTELLDLLRKEVVIPFHKRYCPLCHAIPGSQSWMKRRGNVGDECKVVAVGKRTGKYKSWEPIFIGTHNDPLYDERLSWEGRSDKMTHAFQMCLLDYEFHVLDNAFLIHRPGIKTVKNNPTKPDQKAVAKQNKFIHNVVKQEIIDAIGDKKECAIK